MLTLKIDNRATLFPLEAQAHQRIVEQIARRRQPALVVVHSVELQNQWISRTEEFLGIPAREVGVIGGGKMVVGDRVSVDLVQSLYKCAGVVAPFIGYLVVDECHRARTA